ncbi:Thiamine-monophosphate kinase [archaeon HR06]|nr:Thiamine-monophosphate kinase [archaeon HR06]
MSDLEGLCKRLLDKNYPLDFIKEKIKEEILNYKDLREDKLEELSKAILEESIISRREVEDEKVRKILYYKKSGIGAGLMGVGSRGEGDFFIHKKLAEIASSDFKGVLINAKDMDDAGAIKAKGDILVIAVDGIHSRLSDFPFLAGFHATRASLRDIMVKGSRPLALFLDIHIADDGDVAKLFDFEAGVSVVSFLSHTPIVAGSTLRIGGDMVIGDRISGCVGALGKAEKLLARRRVKKDSVILMTEGSGGGTICTVAIYSGKFEVIPETLNLQFIKACNALMEDKLLDHIQAMSDVTNGGIRGDAKEICEKSKVSIFLYEEEIRSLVNPKVLKLLEDNKIDYLGVSLDSLLIFCDEEHEEEIIKSIKRAGVKVKRVGYTEEGEEPFLIQGKEIKRLEPKFRESAYTKVKKVVGEEKPKNFDEMVVKVEEAFLEAIRKRDYFVKLLST